MEDNVGGRGEILLGPSCAGSLLSLIKLSPLSAGLPAKLSRSKKIHSRVKFKCITDFGGR